MRPKALFKLVRNLGEPLEVFRRARRLFVLLTKAVFGIDKIGEQLGIGPEIGVAHDVRLDQGTLTLSPALTLIILERQKAFQMNRRFGHRLPRLGSFRRSRTAPVALPLNQHHPNAAVHGKTVSVAH